MQNHAPRTFRWVEHMLVPEVQSPEFYARPIEYLANDEVPQTSLDILNWVAAEYGEPFVLSALAFNQAMTRLKVSTGCELSPEQDQPSLPTERIVYDGSERDHTANLHAVWLSQRAQRYYQTQSDQVRNDIDACFGAGLSRALIHVPLQYPLERVNNRLIMGNL